MRVEEAKTKEEFERARELEIEENKVAELLRVATKAKNHAARNMATIQLVHNYGLGDNCPCNNCK